MNTVLVSLYLALCAAIVVLVPSMVMPYVEDYGVVTVFDSAQAVLLCTALASVAGIYAYKQGANGSFLLKLFLAAVLVRLVLATAIFVFRGQDFFGGDAITYDFYGFAQLNGWAGFPWQVISLRQSITLPEMIVWWASFPMLVLGLWFSIKYRLRMMSPILIFTLMLSLGYSIFQGNVGTAYRQRAQLLVFYFIFAAVGYVLMLEKREERKQQDLAEPEAGAAKVPVSTATRR